MEFGYKFYEKVCDLNQWRLWAAGYVITGGLSEDSLHYFLSWIVRKGKEACDLALKDPGELGRSLTTQKWTTNIWNPSP